MSRELDIGTRQNIEEDVVRPFFAVELKFDGAQVIRMWTGQGTLVLPNGTNWVGLGTLLEVSNVEETAEIAVKGATLTLSSVPQEILSLALSEPYQGRVCNIYFGTFSLGRLLLQSDFYILQQDGSRVNLQTGEAGFNEIFSGYMDQMNIEEAADTSTIQLTVENKLVDLERARVARYTSGYQKSLYAGDLGFDFVEDLQDKPVLWGRSSDT